MKLATRRSLPAIFLAFCLAPCIAHGDNQRLDLKTAIEMAMQKNAELKAQKFQEAQAESDLDRVDGEFGPHFDGEFGVGPIDKATGNALASTENSSVWGRSYMGDVHWIQPLYTWNRKSLYKEAATAGKQVKVEETRLKGNEVRYQVKEAYYGVLYAASLLDFIRDGKKDLEKAKADAEKRRKPKAKENYRLDLFVSIVKSKEAEVQENYELAQAGFALRVANASSGFLPKDDWLFPETRKLDSFEHYLAIARENRPEYTQLRLGIQAKRNLASAEWKGLLPVFGFILGYDYADTNVRAPQPGVFAYDPYNHQRVTAGVGLKLDFQYDLQKARAEKASAEADELEAKQEFAQEGIAVDLKKAYLAVQAAETKLEAATEAYKTGKKWLTGEMITFGAGLGDVKTLVDAYGARAETAKNYFEAIFQHNMAWAALSKAAGKEVDPLLQ